MRAGTPEHGAFQHRVADLGGVDDRHAQTGGAAVHIGNVGLAAETLQDLGGNGVAHRRAGAVGADAGLGLEVGAGEQLGLLVVVLTAGGLEVALGDHEVEGEVVQEEVGDALHLVERRLFLVVLLAAGKPGFGKHSAESE